MKGFYLAVNDIEMHKLKRGMVRIPDLRPALLLDIDKTWQSIHYILTGTIEDGDLPFGLVVPIRGQNELPVATTNVFELKPFEVIAVNSALQLFDRTLFLDMYDYELLMEEVPYPPFKGPNSKEYFEELWETFEELKYFFTEAEKTGFGVLFYVD